MEAYPANLQDQLVSRSEVLQHQATSSIRNHKAVHAVASEFEVLDLLEGLLEGLKTARERQPAGQPAVPFNRIVPHGARTAHESLATVPLPWKPCTATKEFVMPTLSQPVMPALPQQPKQAVTDPLSWRPPVPAVTDPLPRRPEPETRESAALKSPQQQVQDVAEPLPLIPLTETRDSATLAVLQQTTQAVMEPLPWKHVPSVSELMRRHTLKSFMEKTCGSVASGFDVLAGRALRSSLGGSGSPHDRLRYMFSQDELSNVLGELGYGVGATSRWWHELFSSLDVDGDGLVSLQDTYDALVLELPPLPDSELLEVFFDTPNQETWSGGPRHFAVGTVDSTYTAAGKKWLPPSC